MIDDDNNVDIEFIPLNYKDVIPILGMVFPVKNLIQGCILGIIGALLCYIIIPYFNLETSTIISTSIIVIGGLTILGIMGVNGDTLFDFIVEFILFHKRKRDAYYNPRVKTEATSVVIESQSENRELLPRDRILALFEKYKDKIDEKNRIKSKENYNFADVDIYHTFFEDDIGIVEKPLEYMTPGERKAYDKNIKKQKKKVEKERRKAEKNAKKKAKKQKKQKWNT